MSFARPKMVSDSGRERREAAIKSLARSLAAAALLAMKASEKGRK